ncbi:hypothetical protein CHS0354_012137 [Potamilus streckersoni]|uniref:Uncharacterized protein n=1 Tax=Potamilus streckersoni TaxID=2493646 RepID=A0AAE0SAL8_9BIVA|nr:hypothetical protein CHS0354_012137 [Potamilus streckersoni]
MAHSKKFSGSVRSVQFSSDFVEDETYALSSDFVVDSDALEITSTKDKEPLPCPLCGKGYQILMMLPCKDSICNQCLAAHIIRDVTNRKKNDGFECPICITIIYPPVKGKPVKDWVDLFPKINNFLDESSIKVEQMCEICKTNHVYREATNYCIVCNKLYCSACFTKSHDSQSVRSHLHTKFTREMLLASVTRVGSKRDWKVEMIKSIETQSLMGGKKEQQWITGGTFLPNGDLVLIDCRNNQCLLYDSSFKYLSERSLPTEPWDVCHVKGRQVAVSIPKSKEIVFLSTGSKIKHDMTVLCNIDCWGIASMDVQHLILSGYDQLEKKQCLCFMNCDGTKQVIRHMLQVEGMVNYIAVNASRTRVYLSSSQVNTVYCYEINGKFIFKYQHEQLIIPRGLDIGENETIYILGSKTNSLHRVSKDGIVLQILSAGLPKEPHIVCFHRSKTQFLVAGIHCSSSTCQMFKLHG